MGPHGFSLILVFIIWVGGRFFRALHDQSGTHILTLVYLGRKISSYLF